MPNTTRSHVKHGQAYFKHTGRYNEVTKSAINNFNNDSTSSLKQKNLAKAGKQTAAAITTKNVRSELGL